MVKLDLTCFKYMSKDEFRVLIAIEMGMKNHNLVPIQLINSLSNIKHGDMKRFLTRVHKEKLVYHENKSYSGYRLTYRGYDCLAIKACTKSDILDGIGGKLGVGKESDVFFGRQPSGEKVAVKFHRLGRISFRTVKINRDYFQNRTHCSWLYLSRLAALKEYSYMKALYENSFPVPRPIHVNRHVVVMEYLQDYCILNHVSVLKNPDIVYDRLMGLIVSLATCGIIHGDFNEFNLMIDKEENVKVIDFPQIISIDHPNAEMYFDRDVECIRVLFRKKYSFESDNYPKFNQIVKKKDLDRDIRASGFLKDFQEDFDVMFQENENHSVASELDEEDFEPESDDTASVDTSQIIHSIPKSDLDSKVESNSSDEVSDNFDNVADYRCEQKKSQLYVIGEDDPEYEIIEGETRKQRRDRLRALQLQKSNELQGSDATDLKKISYDNCVEDLNDKLLQDKKRLEIIRSKVKLELEKKKKSQKIKIKNEFKQKVRRESQLESKRLAII